MLCDVVRDGHAKSMKQPGLRAHAESKLAGRGASQGEHCLLYSLDRRQVSRTHLQYSCTDPRTIGDRQCLLVQFVNSKAD